MKKASSDMPDREAEDMLPEYDFDYKEARLNRFVSEPVEKGRLVVLEPDIAEIFRSSNSVNAVLRALIQTMPGALHPASGS